MRRIPAGIGIAVVAFLVGLVGCGSVAPVDEPGPGVPGPGVLGPGTSGPIAPRGLRGEWESYRGMVSALGDDWFELAPGWESRYADAPPRDESQSVRFSVAGTLPGGDLEAEPGFRSTHLLTDLRVGDLVVVSVGRTKAGEEWATGVAIRRRPGGRIPLYSTHVPQNSPHEAVRDQAEQDWEEKGIPITERTHPLRRADTDPPYPPVAPMPRSAAKP